MSASNGGFDPGLEHFLALIIGAFCLGILISGSTQVLVRWFTSKSESRAGCCGSQCCLIFTWITSACLVVFLFVIQVNIPLPSWIGVVVPLWAWGNLVGLIWSAYRNRHCIAYNPIPTSTSAPQIPVV